MAAADSQMDAALNEVHNHDEKVKAKAAGKDNGKDKRSHGNLPTAFDWRNVNGVNFMLPAVNQVCRMIPRVTPREIPCRMGYRAGRLRLVLRRRRRGHDHSPRRCADQQLGAAAATSTPGLGSPLPHLQQEWAKLIHTGTGLAPTATTAPGLGSPPPRQPHRDWARSRKASVVYGSPLFGATISRKAS